MPLVLISFGLASGAFACSTPTNDASPAAEADIVGGTKDEAHPYVVGLGTDGPWCSATVIDRSTVLTAGHCFEALGDGTRHDLAIWFGFTGEKGGVRIVEGARDPRWRLTSEDPSGYFEHDVAVYKLEHPVDAKVQAAPLLRETLANTPEYVGPNLTFVGYGRPHLGQKWVAGFPIALVGAASVPNHGFTGAIDDSNFYYRVPHRNTCNGDSGGPGFFIRDGVERVAGVTSAGDADCTKDGTSGRTDLPEIQSFIQAKIDAYEGGSECRSDGTCNESCNREGFVGDPDCAMNHCKADGICASACVGDPDCQDSAPDYSHVPATDAGSSDDPSRTSTGGGVHVII